MFEYFQFQNNLIRSRKGREWGGGQEEEEETVRTKFYFQKCWDIIIDGDGRIGSEKKKKTVVKKQRFSSSSSSTVFYSISAPRDKLSEFELYRSKFCQLRVALVNELQTLRAFMTLKLRPKQS